MPALRRTALLLLTLALPLAGCRQGEQPADAAATPTPAGGAAAAAPTGSPAAPGEEGAAFDTARLPEVVARVDGKEIRRQELLERAEAMRQQMAQMGAPEPPQSEEFYREMLDQVIGAHLLYAEAERKGLLPKPDEVTQQLARMKAQFPSEEAYRQQLAARGVSEQALIDDLRRNMAIQKLVTSEVGTGEVTEAEQRKFYEENQDRMKRPSQVQVRHILVGVPQDATDEQRQAARTEAEELLTRVRGGADFAALARQSSDDPGSREQGGLLPWMGRGESVPPFEQAAFALSKGKVSDLVETQFGYHILRLEDTRPEQVVPFEEARPQIESLLRRRQGRDELRQKVEALRAQARVEVLF